MGGGDGKGKGEMGDMKNQTDEVCFEFVQLTLTQHTQKLCLIIVHVKKIHTLRSVHMQIL